MIRGIHSTLYTGTVSLDVDVQQLFEQRFANEPFVDVLPAGICPQTCCFYVLQQKNHFKRSSYEPHNW